jgi:hypothetical protein
MPPDGVRVRVKVKVRVLCSPTSVMPPHGV